MGSPYGKAVVDGTLRYSSASALTTFDPNSYGGCNRKWWFDKVLGKKPESTAAMLRGTKMLHEPIEAYYKTGVEAFPPLVMSGRRYLYPNGSGLFIEQEIGVPFGEPAPTEDKPMTDEQFVRSPVRAGGVPIVGRMDLTHGLGLFIDERGDMQREPNPNTIELNDWKSTSDRGYAKTAMQLREAIQMLTYGKAGLIAEPRAEVARLSHTYFLTTASESWKVTTAVPREEIERRWEYVEGLGRSMRDVASEGSAENVTPNRKSCNSYGRKGCPYKSPMTPGEPPLCSAGRFNSLTTLFGESGAATLLAQQNPTPEIIPVMSILQRVQTNTATPAAAVALPTVTPQNTATHVGVNLTIGAQPTPGTAAPSMLAALEAEDQAATAPAAQLTQQHADAFAIIATAEMGAPTFTGRAASLFRAYGALCSPVRTYPAGAEIKGTGRLAGLEPIEDPAAMLKLAEDLKAHLAKKATAAVAVPTAAPTPPPAPAPAPATVVHMAPPISMLPPEAPASNPALAALPVEGMAMPGIVAQTQTAPGHTTMIVNVAPAAAPTPPPAPAPAAEAKTEVAPAPTKPKAERKTRTAKPKAEGSDDDAFELYIDCIPSKPYESLDGQIAVWCAGLVNFFKTPDDLPDIRSLEDKRMNFNKWPGALAALVRECVVEGKLPRARYVVHTKGSSINQTVVEGMISARYKGADGSDGTGEAVLDGYVRGF